MTRAGTPFSQNDTQVFGKNNLPLMLLSTSFTTKGINTWVGALTLVTTNKTKQSNPKVVTYVTSGLVDGNNGQVLSYLNKSIKALNQLRWMEDNIVIYEWQELPKTSVLH